MDTFGTHPLSCRFSAGRIPRHSALNDVVRRGLSAAGIPSMLEPSGLDRGDGKRPDGITVYPYSRGRCLIWDATCVNTFASSNIIRAALAAGFVADAAEVRKIEKVRGVGPTLHLPASCCRDVQTIGRSILSYCCHVWTPSLMDTKWRLLQRAQNSTLIIATGCLKMAMSPNCIKRLGKYQFASIFPSSSP